LPPHTRSVGIVATMALAPSVTALAENDRATSERGWVSSRIA
jgi:hypothetical protein